MARPLTLLVALALLLVVAAPARAANPVLPGDYPDPSVVAYGGGYVATATSDRWEPVFPVLTSTDLVTWKQVGSVFTAAPAWAKGKRFWAPEIAVVDGRLVVVYAGLKRPGQWCIGGATAKRPEGPWTDLGPIHCPVGGAIDPAIVRSEGVTYLLYKAKGLGGGLYVAPVDSYWLDKSGPSVPVVTPDLPDGGVTEGPAILHHDGSWYLFFSTGNCCGPPCAYVQQVARSSSLLGPYVRAESPVLPEGDTYKCTGHGTPVRTRAGELFLLHHGYRIGDDLNRRRLGLLTRLDWARDGWPTAPEGVASLGAAPVPAGQPTIADDFAGPLLDPAWQWIARRSTPKAAAAAGALELRCGRHAVLTRQVAEDRFDVAVTMPAPRGEGPHGIPALYVRERNGTLRGVEVADGTVRMVRRRATSVKVGPGLPIDPTRGVRLRLSSDAFGLVTAYVQYGSGWLPVPAGPASTGHDPVRVALSCRGTGTSRFTRLRVQAADPGSRLAVAAAARRTALP